MSVDPEDLDLPDHADADEAAAIAVAIEAHLSALRADADGDGADEPAWDGRKWAFAGRMDRLTQRAVRVRDTTPADPWTAAGRLDRL
jgi:hypothetical protein